MKKSKKSTIGVVIPSYMPGITIGHVMKTVNSGIKKYFRTSEFTLIVVDSSDAKTQQTIQKVADNLGKNITLYFANKRITKGKAILTGLDILKSKKPDAVLFIDAEIKSARPGWMDKFLKPILSGEVDFMGPFYTRDKYDSLITNHLIYPFVKVLLKANLRQPIGGDFAISGRLMNYYFEKRCFSPEAEGFGIDIWLATGAILNGFKIGQVYLGIKDHAKTIKDPEYPEKSLGIMFTEVVKTLFDVLGCYENKLKNQEFVDVTTFGEPLNLVPKPVQADFNNLWYTFKRLYPTYQDQIRSVLDKDTVVKIEKLLKVDKENSDFTLELWVKILITYLLKYSQITSESEKRAVIDSLLPVYFGRIACFVYESRNLNVAETEEKIQESLGTFEKEKITYLKTLRLREDAQRKNQPFY